MPKDTRLPPRNDAVKPWADAPEGERKLYTRLQAAYAAMLEHADQHIARLVTFLEEAGQLDDTMIVLMSDNGASQEGGPFGMVNAMGPYNLRREPLEEKIARIEDIGGPDTHSNFPLGWAMAANTPLRRYKQNTHGGGIRDPLVISWPNGLAARGELRHQFCHASDLVPTMFDVVGVKPPATINGVTQMPLEGTSFAASLKDANAPSKAAPQYFEMFGHRGLVKDGWKAVSFHPLGGDFEKDKWELFHLDRDFSETDDLAEKEPAKLKALIEAWWKEAEAHNVLPLDDRFQQRFADNAKRFHGPRQKFVFHAGMGHVPTDVAPDVRSRTYTIEADVQVAGATTEGVLIAHGDMTCGYSLYIKDNRLTYDMNVGGVHHIVVSDRPVPAGNHLLGLRMRRDKGRNVATLLIDGEPAGGFDEQLGFVSFISWSGLDIGRDRSSPVSHYEAPFAFTGKLRKVTFVARRRPGARRQGGGRGDAGPRMSTVVQQPGSRQPLCVAARLPVDVLHRAGRRRDVPAGRGPEGDRGRIRRPPRRAVDGLHAGLLRHGRGRRLHGLAGRSHQPEGAAADRGRVDPGRWLAGGERRRVGAVRRLRDPARLPRQRRHLHAGDEQRAGLVRQAPQYGGVDHLGRAGRVGLRVAADLSAAAARGRLAPVAGDLLRRGGGAALPLRVLRAALAGRAQQDAREAAEDIAGLPMPSPVIMALLSVPGPGLPAAVLRSAVLHGESRRWS